jgi:hypothetical protein
MASAFAKLREQHKQESKKRAEENKFVKDARTVVVPPINKEYIPTKTKIVFDEQKLNKTIMNAKESYEKMKKKPIVILDKNPVPSARVASAVPVAICRARNINGTPCKCKATKLGKFCTKHAP